MDLVMTQSQAQALKSQNLFEIYFAKFPVQILRGGGGGPGQFERSSHFF